MTLTYEDSKIECNDGRIAVYTREVRTEFNRTCYGAWTFVEWIGCCEIDPEPDVTVG